jgi:hypothetical protein
MSNAITLTGLTEILYKSRDIVAAEPVAFCNSVMVNSSGSERVSINGTVKSIRTGQPTLNSSVTPAMTIPAADDVSAAVESVAVGQTANVKIPLRGEELRQLQNCSSKEDFTNNVVAQAFRTIRNAVEAHLATIAYKGASRAVGTAGTTPFATTYNLVNNARQILVDNGCPASDGMVSLVLNTAAGTNLRNLSNLQKVNEAGNEALLRRGVLLDLSGIMLKESAGISTAITAGTMANATTNNAGYAVGATVLTLATAGTGKVAAGDSVTFAGDTNVYVVSTATFAGDNPAAGDTITIAQPGLRKAMSAATKAITVTAAFTPNVLLHKLSTELIIRPPALPDSGDAAADRTTLADSVSGLVFDIALYKGYQMNMLDITTFYQGKVWKPEFVANLLG